MFIPTVQRKRSLSRTTDLCVAAHQDDIEIMAFGPAVKCYGLADKWFTGVVVTDGAGSPRAVFMRDIPTRNEASPYNRTENAASVGGYAAQFLLGYSSSEVKDAKTL